jgi:hypothetical protein
MVLPQYAVELLRSVLTGRNDEPVHDCKIINGATNAGRAIGL